MVVLTTDPPRMELERMATVSLDRLVLLMRVLGPHQMCLVQQTTACGLQHRWQRENQGAQGVFTAFSGEQKHRSPPLHMWAKRVLAGRVMRQSDVALNGVLVELRYYNASG